MSPFLAVVCSVVPNARTLYESYKVPFVKARMTEIRRDVMTSETIPKEYIKHTTNQSGWIVSECALTNFCRSLSSFTRGNR